MNEQAFSELVELVRKMREAQKNFFKSKSHHDLRCARDYERRVDEALQRMPPEAAQKQARLI